MLIGAPSPLQMLRGIVGDSPFTEKRHLPP
jgi:hypothetical protein